METDSEFTIQEENCVGYSSVGDVTNAAPSTVDNEDDVTRSDERIFGDIPFTSFRGGFPSSEHVFSSGFVDVYSPEDASMSSEPIESFGSPQFLTNDSFSESEEDDTEKEPLSAELQQGLRILTEVASDANKSLNWPFMHAVDPNAEGCANYFEKVERPMWLNRMKEKFSDREYHTITEFMVDMRLMLENCYRFNGPDHSISKKAQKLETVLEQKLALLSRELREKTSIAATSGNKSAGTIPSVTGTRRRKAIVPHDSTALLNQLRLEEKEKEKEHRRLQMEERKKVQEDFVAGLQVWEDKLLEGKTRDELLSMWELPQIGHFLMLCNKQLNIGEVMQYELERSFLMPRESTTLQRVMTALTSTPHQRLSLERKPYMPYKVWEEKLCVKVRQWYKTYKDVQRDAHKAAVKLGLEGRFFDVLGPKNPLEKKRFHELTFYQRVWLVKTLCDYVLEQQDEMREIIETQPVEEQREYMLGTDADGNSYLHFPQFCGADVRIYRRAPMVLPRMEKRETIKNKAEYLDLVHGKKKKGRKKQTPKKVLPSVSEPESAVDSRYRDSRLRQNPKQRATATQGLDSVGSDSANMSASQDEAGSYLSDSDANDLEQEPRQKVARVKRSSPSKSRYSQQQKFLDYEPECEQDNTPPSFVRRSLRKVLEESKKLNSCALPESRSRSSSPNVSMKGRQRKRTRELSPSSCASSPSIQSRDSSPSPNVKVTARSVGRHRSRLFQEDSSGQSKSTSLNQNEVADAGISSLTGASVAAAEDGKSAAEDVKSATEDGKLASADDKSADAISDSAVSNIPQTVCLHEMEAEKMDTKMADESSIECVVAARDGAVEQEDAGKGALSAGAITGEDLDKSQDMESPDYIGDSDITCSTSLTASISLHNHCDNSASILVKDQPFTSYTTDESTANGDVSCDLKLPSESLKDECLSLVKDELELGANQLDMKGVEDVEYIVKDCKSDVDDLKHSKSDNVCLSVCDEVVESSSRTAPDEKIQMEQVLDFCSAPEVKTELDQESNSCTVTDIKVEMELESGSGIMPDIKNDFEHGGHHKTNSSADLYGMDMELLENLERIDESGLEKSKAVKVVQNTDVVITNSHIEKDEDRPVSACVESTSGAYTATDDNIVVNKDKCPGDQADNSRVKSSQDEDSLDRDGADAAEATEVAAMVTAASMEKADESSDDEDWIPAEPDLDSFKLVVDSVESLRQLVQLFDESANSPLSRPKGGRLAPKKPCVVELHERLIFLLKELEPWESKLILANKKACIKLRKEQENYLETEEEKQPVKDMWNSEKSASEASDDSDADVNMERQSSTQQDIIRSRSIKTKKVIAEQPVMSQEEAEADLELNISSRGRLRKRRIIPNNTEDQGIRKKKKPPSEDSSRSSTPNILQKSKPATTASSSSSSSTSLSSSTATPSSVTLNQLKQFAESQPPGMYSVGLVGNQPVLIKGLHPGMPAKQPSQSPVVQRPAQVAPPSTDISGGSKTIQALLAAAQHTAQPALPKAVPQASMGSSMAKLTSAPGASQLLPTASSLLQLAGQTSTSTPTIKPSMATVTFSPAKTTPVTAATASSKAGLRFYSLNTVGQLEPSVIQQLLKQQESKVKKVRPPTYPSTSLVSKPVEMQAAVSTVVALSSASSHHTAHQGNMHLVGNPQIAMTTSAHLSSTISITKVTAPIAMTSVVAASTSRAMLPSTSLPQTAASITELLNKGVIDPQFKLLGSPQKSKYASNVTVKKLLEQVQGNKVIPGLGTTKIVAVCSSGVLEQSSLQMAVCSAVTTLNVPVCSAGPQTLSQLQGLQKPLLNTVTLVQPSQPRLPVGVQVRLAPPVSQPHGLLSSLPQGASIQVIQDNSVMVAKAPEHPSDVSGFQKLFQDEVKKQQLASLDTKPSLSSSLLMPSGSVQTLRQPSNIPQQVLTSAQAPQVLQPVTVQPASTGQPHQQGHNIPLHTQSTLIHLAQNQSALYQTQPEDQLKTIHLQAIANPNQPPIQLGMSKTQQKPHMKIASVPNKTVLQEHQVVAGTRILATPSPAKASPSETQLLPQSKDPAQTQPLAQLVQIQIPNQQQKQIQAKIINQPTPIHQGLPVNLQQTVELPLQKLAPNLQIKQVQPNVQQLQAIHVPQKPTLVQNLASATEVQLQGQQVQVGTSTDNMGSALAISEPVNISISQAASLQGQTIQLVTTSKPTQIPVVQSGLLQNIKIAGSVSTSQANVKKITIDQLKLAIAKKQAIDKAIKTVITTVNTSLPTAQIKVVGSSPLQMPSRQPHRPVTMTTSATKGPISVVPNILSKESGMSLQGPSSLPPTQTITKSQVFSSNSPTITVPETAPPPVRPNKTLALKLTPQNIMTAKGAVPGIVLPPGVVLPRAALQQMIAPKANGGQGLLVVQQDKDGKLTQIQLGAEVSVSSHVANTLTPGTSIPNATPRPLLSSVTAAVSPSKLGHTISSVAMVTPSASQTVSQLGLPPSVSLSSGVVHSPSQPFTQQMVVAQSHLGETKTPVGHAVVAPLPTPSAVIQPTHPQILQQNPLPLTRVSAPVDAQNPRLLLLNVNGQLVQSQGMPLSMSSAADINRPKLVLLPASSTPLGVVAGVPPAASTPQKVMQALKVGGQLPSVPPSSVPLRPAVHHNLLSVPARVSSAPSALQLSTSGIHQLAGLAAVQQKLPVLTPATTASSVFPPS